MKITKVLKLLPIVMLTLTLAFFADSIPLMAYADIEQPDGAVFSHNAATYAGSEDDPIVKGTEVLVTNKGLGTTELDSSKWISTNQGLKTIAGGEDNDDFIIYIKTNNHGEWVIVAEGNVPKTELTIYYQFKGNTGSTQIFKAPFTVNGAGECIIVPFYGTGSGSINQVYIGDFEFAKGTLEIIKEVAIIDGIDFVPTTFKFEVRDDNNEDNEVVWEPTIVVDEAGKPFSVYAEDFSPGKYTVTEVDADAYNVTFDPLDGVVEITEGTKITVKATNELKTGELKTGFLAIIKELDGDDLEDGEFYFLLEIQVDGEWVEVLNEEEPLFSVTTINGNGFEVFDIPYGIYRIAEVNADGTEMTSYTVTYFDSYGEPLEDGIIGLVGGGDGGVEVRVTNSLVIDDDEPGKLTINKVGAGAGFSNGTFYFRVHKLDYDEEEEEVWVEVLNGENPLFSVTTENRNGSISIEVPAGTYRVTERTADDLAMTYYTVSYSVTDRIVEVGEETGAAITVTNSRSGGGSGGGSSGGGGSGGGGDTNSESDTDTDTDTDSTITLPEPQVPLTDIPVDIPDTDVPLANVPQTGEEGVPPTFFALFCMALTGMNVTLRLARKSRA